MSITPTIIARDAATTAPAATSIAASTTYTLSIPASVRDDHMLFIEVTTTASGGGTLTVNAGDYPPAFRAGLGALALTLPNSANARIALDPSRFVTAAGTITLTTGTGVDGGLRWFALSRGRND